MREQLSRNCKGKGTRSSPTDILSIALNPTTPGVVQASSYEEIDQQQV